MKYTVAFEAMNEEIRKAGGLLHFDVSTDVSGWHAECIEIDGIITGGKNTKPSDEEISANIREAIHTAFHILPATVGEHPALRFNYSTVDERDEMAPVSLLQFWNLPIFPGNFVAA